MIIVHAYKMIIVHVTLPIEFMFDKLEGVGLGGDGLQLESGGAKFPN